ncbi:MAG: hypothetical protein ACYS3N_16955 [Planctomycetota bacterium]|jgi:hypothetical protein
MKNRLIVILIVISIVASVTTLFLILASGMFWFHNRASRSLLDQIALLQPGQNIEIVKDQLSKRCNEYTSMKDMLIRGSIKDTEFLEGKKLYWFYASTPPCRVLDVYTDMNDIVVYTTWHGL